VKWGLAGPPPEAYSRVTNGARFEPLHHLALARLERLQERFEVERIEGYGLDHGLQQQLDLTRPSVSLVPADSDAAPIVVAFTTFPSVVLRCGFMAVLQFPECGCDACDETAEGEEQQLLAVTDDVVEGRFRESIRIPLFGDAVHEWELRSSTHRLGGVDRFARWRARMLANGRKRTWEWAAWPLR
jgi:uncharacterized protein DUF6226